MQLTRPTLRPFPFAFGLALAASAPGRASAAPAGDYGRALHVVHLAAGNADDVEAIRLTKALERYALASPALEFVNSNKALLEGLRRARCGNELVKKALAGEPLEEHDDASIDAPCLEKLAAYVGTPLPPAGRFVWGHIYRDGTGARWAKLHAHLAGQPDRVFAVRYESAQSERAAERLLSRLFFAGGLGEARVEPPAGLRGDVWVNDKPHGPFEPAAPEIVLPAGSARVELRAGKRVLARGQGQVAPGETRAFALASVDEPGPALPPPSLPPPTGATPTSETPWPPALPWMAAGVGAVGVATAGVFAVLYSGVRSDLDDQCSDSNRCPASADGDLDRARFYGTASLVSLGVGVAGVGAAAALWLVAPRFERTGTAPGPRWGGGVAPAPGGGALFMTGRF
ncbi:MAG TPA: hypothetical protein VFS43_10620 [Polyangiaceae bacterium]|nr:hypothetical protein [Polyangiaceae bacterium]